MGISNMVLRTVYLKPEIDDELRQEAHKRNVSKNDLIRNYIEKGMEAEKAKKTARQGPASAARNPRAVR